MVSFASEVWNWLQKQNAPFTMNQLAYHEGGRFLLPLYGQLQVPRLVSLLDAHAKPLVVRRVHALVEDLKEIVKLHRPNLINRSEIQLPLNSRFLERSIYEYLPLDRSMLQRIREAIALSPCPIAEARLYKFHRIPHYPPEEGSINSFLEGIDTKNRQTIQFLLSLFDETTPPLERRTLTPEQWMECQMAAISLEALPGVSFCDLIALWGKQNRTRHLATHWLELCPFWQLLQGKNGSKVAANPIVFNRPQELVLGKNETLRSYLVLQSQHAVCAQLLKTTGAKFKNLNVDGFLALFVERNRAVFQNEPLRLSILYFIDFISKKYRDFLKDGHTLDMPLARSLLFSNYKYLKRLFTKETFVDGKLTKSIPLQNRTAYSLSLGVLLFYHTVLVAPAELSLDPFLFQEFVDIPLAQQDELISYWKEYEPAQNRPTSKLLNLPNLLRRFCPTLHKRLLLLTEVIADGCNLRPKAAPLDLAEHLQFLKRLEELTDLKIHPHVGFFLLTELPLKQEVLRFLDDFQSLNDLVKMGSKQDGLYIPVELIDHIEDWNLNKLPKALTTRTILRDTQFISAEIIGGVASMVNFCLLPVCISWKYCRFLALMQQVHTTDEHFKYWQWADLHNQALIELSPNFPAMRCEVTVQGNQTKALTLSILWVSSLSTFTTRRACSTFDLSKIPLEGQNVLQLISLTSQLCESRQPPELALEHINPTLFACCSRLKKEMAQAITHESEPIVTFNENEQCFYLTALNQALPLQAVQVQLTDYKERFLSLLQAKKDVSKAITAHLWRQEGLCEPWVDFLYVKETKECMGDNEEENKIIPKVFYRITLRLTDMPAMQVVVTYLEPPTPQLIAWQLALLKERFYTSSFFS